MNATELPVRALPHCPNPVRIPASDRWTGDYTAEVCHCPRDHPHQWRVHWVHRGGRQMHCPCGPRQRAHCPPGDYLVTTNGGYACAECAPRLPSSARGGTPLVSDLPCCYCGKTALMGRGYSVASGDHPELMPAT